MDTHIGWKSRRGEGCERVKLGTALFFVDKFEDSASFFTLSVLVLHCLLIMHIKKITKTVNLKQTSRKQSQFKTKPNNLMIIPIEQKINWEVRVSYERKQASPPWPALACAAQPFYAQRDPFWATSWKWWGDRPFKDGIWETCDFWDNCPEFKCIPVTSLHSIWCAKFTSLAISD